MKIDKIVCIFALYLIARDFYFIRNIKNSKLYQQHILDATYLLEKILESESNKDIMYLSIILVLSAIILVLIAVIKYVYKKEIQRLVKERSRLMHDFRHSSFTPLEKHNSSKWEEKL